jgi:hypothetical protein
MVHSVTRIFVWAVLPLLAVLVAIGAWFTWFLELDDYRDQLAALLSERTGLSIQLNGRIEHYLLDGLHVRIGDMKVRLGATTIADIPQVRAQIALRDLLERRLTIERLDVIARHLDLAFRPDIPWRDDPVADIAPGAVIPFNSVTIEHLRLELQNGRVADLQAGRELLIQDVVAEVGPLPLWPDSQLAGRTVQVSGGQLSYSGIQLENFTVKVNSDGEQRLDMIVDSGKLRWAGLAQGGNLPHSAEADVEANARIRFDALSATHLLQLEQLNLALNRGRLNAAEGPYDFRRARLKASDLPLLAAMAPGPPGQPVRSLSGSTVQLTVEGLAHKGRTGQLELGEERQPWELEVHSPRVAMQPLLAFFNSDYDARGNLAVTMKLKGQELEHGRLRESLSGRILMHGGPLQVRGVDLDQMLTHLEKTRSVGLLDIGAYALAGPAGALLTKGSDYSRLLNSSRSEGVNEISRVRSELRIENGVLRTEDVAMATPKHRLAVRGSVDLRPGGPIDLQIAILDPDGCARYQENVGGTAADLRVRQSGVVVKGVIGPVKSVVGNLLDAVSGGCQAPFYRGEVPHPAPADAPSYPSPEPSLDP